MRIVALMPMKHHSERVPGKNVRRLGDSPLYHHVLRSLLGSRHIDQVAIDTDSPVIMDGCASLFPEVILLERPQALRGDHVPMNDILIHDVEQVEADLYVQTHSTNPFLTTRTIDTAIEEFNRGRPSHDSLFSVIKIQTRFWTAEGKPLNHDPLILQRTQDLPPLYEENSCLYIFTRDSLLDGGSRIGASPLLFEMDPGEALDIDTEWDFRLAELRMNLESEGSQ